MSVALIPFAKETSTIRRTKASQFFLSVEAMERIAVRTSSACFMMVGRYENGPVRFKI